MDINDLVKLIQGNYKNININVTINTDPVEVVEDAPALPDTDFEVGDRVLVRHIRKDGERVHTVGTVDTILGQDDKGWYTRVTGDNGKHYRAGLVFDEERLGTVIYRLD